MFSDLLIYVGLYCPGQDGRFVGTLKLYSRHELCAIQRLTAGGEWFYRQHRDSFPVRSFQETVDSQSVS